MPVLKDPKKISKMLKKLQKVRVFALAVAPAFTRLVAQAKRMKRQHETAGSDPQALLRLQKKVVISRARLPPLAHFAEISDQIDRFSAMDSLSDKDSKKLRKAGIGKK